MTINANNILFRCSALGQIMTESRTKSEPLSKTTKSYLSDKYVSVKYGRENEISSKYIAKGLQVEEDSITLFSRVKKTFFKKNELTLSNDFICGTPDLFTGSIIHEAQTIIDIKSSWDIFTFFRTTQDDLNKNYYWQLQGYMALTGAKQARLVYCLVKTPDAIIYDEKRKLQWKMCVINPETDANFIEACDKLELLSKYDDIPLEERVNEIVIERNESDIKRIYARVTECREYMNKTFFKQ